VREQNQQHQTANATNLEHKVEGQSRRIDLFLVHRQSLTLLLGELSVGGDAAAFNCAAKGWIAAEQ
jgi:hypothetical protein